MVILAIDDFVEEEAPIHEDVCEACTNQTKDATRGTDGDHIREENRA